MAVYKFRLFFSSTTCNEMAERGGGGGEGAETEAVDPNFSNVIDILIKTLKV